MNKDSIIHFVGFITQLHREKFTEQWARYARESSITPGGDIAILQERANTAGKYKYISQHEFSEENFRFSFLKNRSTENFPEQKARVVMLGGYTPVEIGNQRWNEKTDAKILVFLSRDSITIDSYRDILYTYSLNIYEPFYENCAYSYILEFFSRKNETAALVTELQKRKEGEELSMYGKCRIPSPVDS